MTDNSDSNDSAQDLLSEILDSLRLSGSVFFRSQMTAPWGIDLPSAHEPRFHLVLAGNAWLHSANMAEPLLLEAGTAVLLRDGEAHWIADHPETPKVSSADASEAYTNGRPLFQGPRTDCHMLCGLFRFDREIRHPLFETLPTLGVIRNVRGGGLEWVRRTGAFMDDEMVHARPGIAVMMDRVCELFLIQLLRHLLETDGPAAGFVAALDDPHISRVLKEIHGAPAYPWGLDNLAAVAGLSRSAFATRFNKLVGMPPKTYLTTWRMQKARSLLRNPYKLLGQIAQEVGYSSDVALIRALQRHFGKSPKTMRSELAQAAKY